MTYRLSWGSETAGRRKFTLVNKLRLLLALTIGTWVLLAVTVYALLSLL